MIEEVATGKIAPVELVYCHEGGDLYAENVYQHMAILPEVTMPAVQVTIDDIQVGDPEVPLTEDQKKLR